MHWETFAERGKKVNDFQDFQQQKSTAKRNEMMIKLTFHLVGSRPPAGMKVSDSRRDEAESDDEVGLGDSKLDG